MSLKKIFLLLLLSSCTCKTNAGNFAVAPDKYYYFKVTEAEEGLRYFLKDAHPCKLYGIDYICGTYEEPGWLNSKKTFVNPKYITSGAEFDSLADFQEALKKAD